MNLCLKDLKECMITFQEGASPTAEVQAGFQSRFSQWFSSRHGGGGGSMGNSRENSRRSSINEDFGYLNGKRQHSTLYCNNEDVNFISNNIHVLVVL